MSLLNSFFQTKDPVTGPLFIRDMKAREGLEVLGVLQQTQGFNDAKIFTERLNHYSAASEYALVAVMPGKGIVGFAFGLPNPQDKNKLVITDIEALDGDHKEYVLKRLIRGIAVRALSHGQKSLDIMPRDSLDAVLSKICEDYDSEIWMGDDHPSDVSAYTIRDLSTYFGKQAPVPADPQP